MLEQAVGVFAEAPVHWPARRLDVGHVPGLRPEHPQERLRVHRARTHLDVHRLLDETALGGPVVRELENQILECHGAGLNSFTTRAERSSFSRCSAISGVRPFDFAHRRRSRLGRIRSTGDPRPRPQKPTASRDARATVRALGAHIDHVRARPAPRHFPTRAPAARTPIERRIHSFEPHQPVLEVSRQRLHRSRRDRAASPIAAPRRNSRSFARSRAPTRPAARQNMPRVPARARPRRCPSVADLIGVSLRLDAVEPDQFPALALDVGRPPAGQGSSAAPNRRRDLVAFLATPALLAAVLGQEDHDAVRFAVAIGAKDERFGGIGLHGWPAPRPGSPDGVRLANHTNNTTPVSRRPRGASALPPSRPTPFSLIQADLVEHPLIVAPLLADLHVQIEKDRAPRASPRDPCGPRSRCA